MTSKEWDPDQKDQDVCDKLATPTSQEQDVDWMGRDICDTPGHPELTGAGS